MELGRLNRIIDYDEKLGYLTVEPGVTFRQASDYLRAKEFFSISVRDRRPSGVQPGGKCT